ncbi:MAG: hypothetical protein KJ864_02170 [Candidatus Omnitrophica bacterium]|nr:hypothetical protein [Candidatus Omnitrophota bacterium]
MLQEMGPRQVLKEQRRSYLDNNEEGASFLCKCGEEKLIVELSNQCGVEIS